MKILGLITYILVLAVGIVSTVLGFINHNEWQLWLGGLNIGVSIIDILWWFARFHKKGE